MLSARSTGFHATGFRSMDGMPSICSTLKTVAENPVGVQGSLFFYGLSLGVKSGFSLFIKPEFFLPKTSNTELVCLFRPPYLVARRLA